MTWTGPADAPVTTRIAALAPSFQPTERLVIDLITADLAQAVECTAQQLAERAGVGRASVIRTAQRLGYDGYPQMRVALARELSVPPADGGSPTEDPSSAAAVRAAVLRAARTLPRVAAALDEQAVDETVRTLDSAHRLVIGASGLSVPLGLSTAMRLGAADRPAEFLPDPLSQVIAARSLGEGSACLVISGSGANPSSLDVAAAAKDSGARVLALTSFTTAPLVDLADTVLVVPTVHASFTDELLQTSRMALTLVLEGLVELLVARRGEQGVRARAAVVSLLGERISE